VPLPLPTGLSPSKVESFTSCPLAFRFTAIDRLPEPPSIWTSKGTLVHRALELLYAAPPAERTVERALDCLSEAFAEMSDHPDLVDLHLDDAGVEQLLADSDALVRRYFELEDPTQVDPIGLELHLEAEIGGVRVRGIIDRLERDVDGELVVTDYKTGKAPGPMYEAKRLNGVHIYAKLCEANYGKRPARVQLLYLADPLAIIATPSDNSIRLVEKKTAAIWDAIGRACLTEDFRPKTGPLCNLCHFKQWCPAFGGDPAKAAEDLGVVSAAVANDPMTGRAASIAAMRQDAAGAATEELPS
jgi:putative RecB family exonuclease